MQGFDLLLKNHIDLVITDLVMDPIDGIEVLKKTKAINKDIKVILMTGYNNTSSTIGILSLDVDGFIIKPCETEEINARINYCLKKKKIEHKLNKKSLIQFKNKHILNPI